VILYGERWAEAAPLLRWMAIGEMAFIAVPLQMDVPILLGRIRQLIWFNLADTIAAVTFLAIGSAISLEAAAISRVAYGLAWWTLYAPFLCRLLDLPMRDLIATYLRSGVCAAAAGLPLALAWWAGLPPKSVGFFELAGLSGLGVFTWLGALWLVRHPARVEVRMVLARLMPARRLQPAE